MRTSTCFSIYRHFKKFLSEKICFLCKMDGIRGKRVTKPNESPVKRKRVNATEAASSVSRIDGPQPKTIGWNKSKRGRVARRLGEK